MTKLGVWEMAGAVLSLWAATAIAAPAQTFTKLANFEGTDGGSPISVSLVQGIDGAFYGTTALGGDEGVCNSGCGTVFKITSSGTLAAFDLNVTNGLEPLAGLLLATNGHFYGTAALGGASGGGTIFEITAAGQLIAYYNFCTEMFGCPNGYGFDPMAAVIQAVDGSFYGTTLLGGNRETCPGAGCGTVFQLTPTGALTTLYSFCSQTNCTDGSLPDAGLIQASDGDFYGTTYGGGSKDEGTIFKITEEGTLTTLHSFDGNDGINPHWGLLQAIDGNFYGTTNEGGTYAYGTIFEVTPNGAFSTLYNFCSQINVQGYCADGSSPGGLVQATDGSLYGLTLTGGANNDGTIFRITTGDALTTLYSFCSQPTCTDGSSPSGALLQATNGNFYGTTTSGGDPTCQVHSSVGCGTVFSLSTGLGPFVTFVRPAGRVGHTGPILGQGFTGTTSVSLNGTPASFTVVSDTFINATVPVGGTTGFVTVTTPSGTLTSNVPFRVIP